MSTLNKAVFLDRDGTIIEDPGYVSSPEQIKFIPGAIEAIKLLKSAGYKIIIISNQSGVARGFLSENMLQTIDKIIKKQVLSGGGQIDASYYCPHHPEHGVYPYKQLCACRKPHPGLINQAAAEHNLDLSASFMIGDKACDIETGKSAGVRSILVLSGMGKEELKDMPDRTENNLLSAAKWIAQQNGKP